MSHASMKTVSNEFVDRLVRGICHDLGAPTRHIVQFSQMLNCGQKGMLESEKQLKWLSFINDSGMKTQKMLSSLNQLSLISSSLLPESINLEYVFGEVLDNLKLNNRERWQGVQITASDKWPIVDGIKSHWQMLFRYLLENAVLFHPKDETHKIKINVKCVQSDAVVFLIVEDNGIGLTESQFPDATKPFKRFNHVEEYEGVGMGLTYCDYISQLNNASIEFGHSELGGLQVTYRQSC